MNKAFCLILLGLLFSTFHSYALPIETPNFIELAGLSPYTHYKTFDTPHFTFIYPEEYFKFTKIAAQELEHAHTVLAPILKWEPRGKTTVLISGNQDDANGFAMPALRVGIVLIATPPDAWFSTAYSDNWIKLLVFHEYVHMLNLDPTTGVFEVLRYLLGDVIRPNGLWPTWMIEGLAVFYETKTSPLGRGRSPYYESILRAYVNEAKFNTRKEFGISLDRVNGDFPIFPGGEIPYLFGYHLWQEMALNQAEKADEVVGEYSLRSSHRFPYLINGNLKNLTQHTWRNYWDTFVVRTQSRMKAQIDAVKAQGETPHQQVTRAKYSALGGSYSPDGNWLAWSETSLDVPRQGVFIKNLKTEKITRIDDKVLGTTISFTPDSKWLVFSALRKFETFQLYSDLFAYQVNTEKLLQITQGQRAKDPSVSADGKKIIFVQNQGANNTLASAEISFNDEQFELKNTKTVYTPSDFSILGTPRFQFQSSHEVVASIQELNHPYSDLVLVNIDATSSKILFHDGHFNRYPYPTKDGVLFTSEKTGIENIYLLPSIAKTSAKIIAPTQSTNVITGVQFPFLSPSGELLGSLLTSSGLEISKFSVPTHLSKSEPSASAVFAPNAPTSLPHALLPATEISFIDNQVQNYSHWGSMAPRQWAPVALVEYQSYSGLFILGEALGFDASGKHGYFADAGYHFKSKTVDGGLSYMYYGFRPKITAGAFASTTDIGTDSLKQKYNRTYELSLQFEYPFIWTFYRLIPRLYGFLDWNRTYDLRTFKPAATSAYEYSQPIVPGLGGSISFSRIDKSKLGFVPEGGYSIYLASEGRFNETKKPFWKYLASATTYHMIWPHFVLQPKMRYVASTQYMRTENSGVLLENGSTTSLDSLGVRGYANALYLAKSAVVGSLDFHFPLFRFYAGAGTTPAFLKQLHGFAFGESAFIPSSKYKNLYFPSVGGGIILDTTLLIHVPISFVAQVQQGLRKDLGGDTVYGLGISALSL